MKNKTKVWVSGGIGFVVTSLILVGAYWSVHGDWFNLQSVQIEMEESSNQEVLFNRIRSELAGKLNSLIGLKAWEVELGGLLSEIESDSRVKAAYVSRQFPNKLFVRILPRDPVLVLAGAKGFVYPVASDASLLPAILAQDAPDLPLLRGSGFAKNENWRKKVIELLEEVPQEGDVGLNRISEVHYTPEEGLEVVLMGKGVKVSLGEKAISRKLKRVERVLHYLQEHQIDGRVIDAKFSKKVVVRLRNAP
ncbi:MAG: FtsQ-type POTRA domain-containing protein [Bdellovibrionaceae bacterium]|nr:cell division protein FtsQ/DivIB [Bdellovibrionales bacterium]MCB9084777.1 FtsQ-type POTRA domain-containing protein [Pseudobdellovibrionaceae bacterium]